MKRKTLLLVLAAVMTLLLCFPLGAYATPTQMPCGCYGTVQDMNGNPVPSGTVQAYIDGVGLCGETAIVDGNFRELMVAHNEATLDGSMLIRFKVVIKGTEMDAVSNPAQVFWLAGDFYDGDNNPLIHLIADYKVIRDKGDINNDGVIGDADVNKAIGFALQATTPTADEFVAADINDDGRISVLDVVSIIKMQN
ncbi:MAG TPA: hypothetical protein DEF34_10625 [Desulfotomaculum sp.]|nr:MAG: hypothetical protein JL56_04280 [Desulfotomaculum sp. BICA1-6]HBX24066.1 hypothetical protein [Desulfotomaculum sp.]